jgi:hypothetical protein
MRTCWWVVALLALPAATAWSQTLRPFTPVASVCPTCAPSGPPVDRVVLRDGTELKVRVVAENERFYVLERFGELRAVGRDQVQTVEKNPNAERPAFDDQILLQNGIVLAGTIKTKDDADPFEIANPLAGTTITAFRSVIASVYRGGRLIFPVAR